MFINIFSIQQTMCKKFNNLFNIFFTASFTLNPSILDNLPT